jgi:hypothetical protein
VGLHPKNGLLQFPLRPTSTAHGPRCGQHPAALQEPALQPGKLIGPLPFVAFLGPRQTLPPLGIGRNRARCPVVIKASTSLLSPSCTQVNESAVATVSPAQIGLTLDVVQGCRTNSRGASRRGHLPKPCHRRSLASRRSSLPSGPPPPTSCARYRIPARRHPLHGPILRPCANLDADTLRSQTRRRRGSERPHRRDRTLAPPPPPPVTSAPASASSNVATT